MKKIISIALCFLLIFIHVSFSANAASQTYIQDSDVVIYLLGSKIVGTGSASCNPSATESFSINLIIQSRTRYTTTESWNNEQSAANSTTNIDKSAAASVNYDSSKEYRAKLVITIYPKDGGNAIHQYKYTAIYRP